MARRVYSKEDTKWGTYWWLDKFKPGHTGVFLGEATTEDYEDSSIPQEHSWIVQVIESGGIESTESFSTKKEASDSARWYKRFLSEQHYGKPDRKVGSLPLTSGQKSFISDVKTILASGSGTVEDFSVNNMNERTEYSEHYAVLVSFHYSTGNSLDDLHSNVTVGKNGGVSSGSIRRFTTERSVSTSKDYFRWLEVMVR